MQIIVIAVIVLIVLVVLIAMFSGRINLFAKGVSDCKAKGGNCHLECKPDQAGIAGICPDDELCCIPIG